MTSTAQTPEMRSTIEAARRRRARMAEEQRLNKMVRVLVTPEGAALHLKLATAAERAGAFAIDVSIQWAIVIATFLGLAFGAESMGMESANIASLSSVLAVINHFSDLVNRLDEELKKL